MFVFSQKEEEKKKKDYPDITCVLCLKASIFQAILCVSGVTGFTTIGMNNES